MQDAETVMAGFDYASGELAKLPTFDRGHGAESMILGLVCASVSPGWHHGTILAIRQYAALRRLAIQLRHEGV
jgi:hypothetical protein